MKLYIEMIDKQRYLVKSGKDDGKNKYEGVNYNERFYE